MHGGGHISGYATPSELSPRQSFDRADEDVGVELKAINIHKELHHRNDHSASISTQQGKVVDLEHVRQTLVSRDDGSGDVSPPSSPSKTRPNVKRMSGSGKDIRLDQEEEEDSSRPRGSRKFRGSL